MDEIKDIKNVLFKDFAKEVYMNDVSPALKKNTIIHKQQIIINHLIPYFGDMKMGDITAADILRWQNTKMAETTEDGKPYAQSYLWTMNREFNAVMNHAENYYDLEPNPVKKTKKVGRDSGINTQAWTLEEYQEFSDQTIDTQYYMPFQILYWCGLRVGELLALTPEDIDLNRREISITKSYIRIGGEDIISTPKTQNSYRKVRMPAFLAEELGVYLRAHRKIRSGERIFQVSRLAMSRVIHKFAKAAGVPDIRVHDLRHSYVSLLINNGFSAYEIGQSVGHGGAYITYRYAHLFDESKRRMADKLDDLYNGRVDDDEKKDA